MRSWLLACIVLQVIIRTASSSAQRDELKTVDDIVAPPNNLTGSWRLFVDHSNIGSMENVQRVNHQFTRHPGNPVITEALLYGTVLPAAVVPAASQQDRYWMWYSIPDAFAFGIATSADGLVWDRPALCAAGPGCSTGGVCKRCGASWSKETALVYDKAHPDMFFTRTNSNSKLGGLCTSLNATRGVPSCCRDTDMSVVYTPWDTQKTFKMFNFNYGQDKEPAHDADGYYSAHSQDGATFHDDVATNPALPASGAGNPNDPSGPENHGDVSNFNFDFHTTDEYFATIKQFFVVNTSTGWTEPRRSVGVSRTRNYTSWPLPTKAIVVDEIDESWTKEKPKQGNHTELYGLSAFAYESAYLGFLWVAHFNDHTDGTIEIELVSSTDGVNWTRAPVGPDGQRPSVLPRGLSPQASTSTAWDGMMVFTPNHPLVEGPEIKLFYEGCSNSHHGGADKCGVGIATMRQHGFVSLAHSGGEPGIILTTPIPASSYREGDVRINYRNTSSAGGTIRVAVLETGSDRATITGTQQGRAVEDCEPMRGDDLNRSVAWSTGDRVLPVSSNASLVLKFELTGDVELFSFSLKTVRGTPTRLCHE